MNDSQAETGQINLSIHILNPGTPGQNAKCHEAVLEYDSDPECEGLLRHENDFLAHAIPEITGSCQMLQAKHWKGPVIILEFHPDHEARRHVVWPLHGDEQKTFPQNPRKIAEHIREILQHAHLPDIADVRCQIIE